MTLNYGQLHLAARETLERVGARFTLDNFEMALNAVTTQAAQRPTAPTTLPAAVKKLNEEIAKLDRALGPTPEASPPASGPDNPAPGAIYLDEERGTVRTTDRGWSGRERLATREYALPNPHATSVPQPLKDKQAK